MKDLETKTALVTGAARGIGLAIAQELSEMGARIVIGDVVEENAAAGALDKCGADTRYVRFDVSSPEEVEAAFKKLQSDTGGIQILVNNAGVSRDALHLRLKDEDWRFTLNINLYGAVLCSKAAVRSMMRSKWGRIINIASVVGERGNVGQTAYAASKGGLIAFTKVLAREYAGRNITANAVAPGFIETEMTRDIPEDRKNAMMAQIPMGILGQPSDIAAAVAFLASNKAKYITGHVLRVNGGMYM